MALTLLQSPPALLLARQPAVYGVSTNSAEDPLRIHAEVSGYGDDSILPDSNDEAYFDLSQYLQGIGVINVAMSAWPVAYSNGCPEFTINISEYYDDKDNNTITYSIRAVDGKVPNWKHDFYASYSSFLAYITATNAFLTWFPRTINRTVTPAESLRIYWLQFVSPSTYIAVKLRTILTFSDGTTATMDESSTFQANPYRVFEWGVGYTDLGIAAWVATNYPGKTVQSYTVQVVQNVTGVYSAVSEALTFILDNKYYSDTRQLLFRNSLGAFDTIMLKGIGKKEYNFERETADKSRDLSSAETVTVGTPDRITWRATSRRKVTANTGWITRQELDWLNELMESTEAYEVISGKLYPVNMLSDKVTHTPDNEYLHSATIEYEYANNSLIEKA
jgi:hypothetical protein